MTGPEHYQAAERMLGTASEVDPDSDIERYCLGAAKVHATLALAAASALGMAGPDVVTEDVYRAWEAVAATPKPGPEGI